MDFKDKHGSGYCWQRPTEEAISKELLRAIEELHLKSSGSRGDFFGDSDV